MAADGSIVIEVNADDKKAQAELNRLSKSIERIDKSLYEKKSKQSAIKSELEAAKESALETERQIDKLKKELAESKSITSGNVPVAPAEYISQLQRHDEITAQLKEQEDILAKQDKETQRLDAQYAKITDKVIQETNSLNAAKNQAGEIQRQLASASTSSDAMANAMDRMQKSANKFSMRLREVVRSALVFTVISQGFAALRRWLGEVITANAQASAAIAKLKGALLTLAQPLLQVVIPAFTAFVQVLTSVVSAIAQLFAMLTGTTIESSKEAAEALDKETAALEGTGAAAEEAAGSLAGFDEINQISSGTSAGGDGGVSAGGAISPDFDFESDLSESQLKNILGLVEAIGTAFLTWRISKALGLDLQQTLGLAVGIYSTIQLVKNIFDAWTNGVNWDNLYGSLLSVLGLVGGLYVAFGKLGAGIGLVASGIALLVTGFHDAMENGWNLENLLMSISGIMGTGLGIAVLTGSWIPALIAGIASLLLAFTVATGHGEELLSGIQTILQGFVDFFTGIFTGDIEKAISGVEKIFDGLGIAVGAVIDGIRDTFLSFLTWLDEKTNGQFHGIIETIKSFFTTTFNSIKNTLQNVIESVKQIFTGLTQFISGVFTQDWDLAWQGVQNIFKGIWNGIVSALEGAVNLIIKGINWLITQLNKISFTVPDWVPLIGGNEFGFNIPKINEVTIPRLAQGAVIPPNREFMAVLGDQSNGNNLEAPESLLRQIVREESGGMTVELLQQILSAIQAGQVIKVNETVLGRTSAKAINKVTRSSGKPVLLY